MSSPPIIFFKNYELVVALNRKIIFVNPNDLQIFKEVEIDADLVPLGLNPPTLKSEDNDEELKLKPKKPVKEEEAKIQHVALSDDLQWLAVTTSGQKALLLYKCRPEHAKLVSVRAIPRASSAVIFAPSSSSLLVCDKTGDCYQFDVEEGSQNPGKLVVGHLSIVYDVLFPGEKYIITSDRDEKIRVTNYPQSYEIANYCLGHKEYVSSIRLLPGLEDSTKLVSLSGDETLKVWDYLSGEKLGNLDLPAPGIKLVIRRLSDKNFEVAVLVFHPTTQIIKYKMEQETFTFEETSKHNFPETTPVDICFVEDRLYVNTLTKDGKLQVEIIGDSSSNQWRKMVQDYFKDDSCEYNQEEDVTGWFKKKYDNLTEYFDRKKKRMCA